MRRILEQPALPKSLLDLTLAVRLDRPPQLADQHLRTSAFGDHRDRFF
ncbi:MAG TPA: hypothetical protein VGQ58_05920 [Candidatus Limnocylindrales bacterium]|nr:hypothetical protein [Candidatus Limnocylindrales bacterium]